MACLSPITLFRKDFRQIGDYRSDVVPCGRCVGCLRRRQSTWTFRLMKEYERAYNAAFITLTYNDDNLPFSENGYMTLVPKHLQDFVKRLRIHIDRNILKHGKNQIKYYGIGEYGERFFRPHYHLIVFNVPRRDPPIPQDVHDYISSSWSFGHVHTGDLTIASVKYVTGYIHKRSIVIDDYSNDDRVPEFSRMSKRLGDNFLTSDMVQYYKDNLLPYLKDGDVKLPLPRYYRDKIYDDSEKALLKAKTDAYLEEIDFFSSPQHEVDWKNKEIFNFSQKNKVKRLHF